MLWDCEPQDIVLYSVFVRPIEPSRFHEQTRTQESMIGYLAGRWLDRLRGDLTKGIDISTFLNGKEPKDMRPGLTDMLRDRMNACNWTCVLTGQKYCLCGFKNCFNKPSIDRVVCDPSKGHVPDNIQILSVALNRLKNEMCHLDFPIMLSHMRRARSEWPLPEPALERRKAPETQVCPDCNKELPLSSFSHSPMITIKLMA